MTNKIEPRCYFFNSPLSWRFLCRKLCQRATTTTMNEMIKPLPWNVEREDTFVGAKEESAGRGALLFVAP